jgi:uncharacterized protein YgbK (DUF1537 family)
VAVATGLLSSFCIVADDLSGAADCASAFAGVAGPVPVFVGGAFQAHADGGVALDTDTRAMDEAQAAATVGRVFGELARAPASCDLVYKKIDSTLRGHVGAELVAALAAAPALRGAIVAPAFPQQGRALVQGRLVVHGRAPDHLGHPGDLMAMLDAAGLRPALLAPPYADAQALAGRIDALLEQGARAVAVDAGDDAELAALAAALAQRGRPLLVAGSAGLAHALAAHVRCANGPGAAPPPLAAGAVLTMVGSFAAASAAQVREVQAHGAAQVIRLTPRQWLDEQHVDVRRSAADAARGALASGRNVLLAVDGEVVSPFSRDLVHAMARLALPLLPQVRRCVLTGGDTARALFDAAGIARLDVIGELEPGVSIGRAPARPDCEFILKAGGFGDSRALLRAIVRGAGTLS